MEVQHGACIKSGNHGTKNRLNNFPLDLLEQMDIWAASTSDLLQDWRESRWREKQKELQDLLLDTPAPQPQSFSAALQRLLAPKTDC